MMTGSFAGVLLLAAIWGFRHGIDWDHIAAIVDLTSSERNHKKGFVLSLWYAFGHEMVIVMLGGSAILFGSFLPSWIDNFMEKFVGITLVLLSIYLLNVLLRKNKEMILVSRWRLIYAGFANAMAWLCRRFLGKELKWNTQLSINMTPKGAFVVGVIHGIGAETPSQLILFAAASGAGSPAEGIALVTLFVAGLLLSHVLLITLSLLGFSKLLKRPGWYRSIAITASAYSLIIGCIFIFGLSSFLPSLM